MTCYISNITVMKHIQSIKGLRVSPLSGQKRGLFKVHFVPALNDFIVSTILSKNRSSESLYIQRSLSSCLNEDNIDYETNCWTIHKK